MRFPGIIPAVTTPFDAYGAVDTAGLAANVRFLLDAGVHGIVATGTMGEAGSLDAAERRARGRDRRARRSTARVPVIAGVSAGTAAAAIALRRATPPRPARTRSCACRRSATAPTSRELIAFYGAVAEAAGLPVMLYNNPEASGVDLRAEQIVAIADRVDGDRRRQGVLGRRAPDPGADRRRAASSRSSSAATTGRSRASPRARPAG